MQNHFSLRRYLESLLQEYLNFDKMRSEGPRLKELAPWGLSRVVALSSHSYQINFRSLNQETCLFYMLVPCPLRI